MLLLPTQYTKETEKVIFWIPSVVNVVDVNTKTTQKEILHKYYTKNLHIISFLLPIHNMTDGKKEELTSTFYLIFTSRISSTIFESLCIYGQSHISFKSICLRFY